MASCQRSEVYYMANFKSAILTTGSMSTVSGTTSTLIAATDVGNEDRLSFQFYNNGTTAADEVEIKVYGMLAVSGNATLGDVQYWTQIGDTIAVSGQASSLKSIATTGLNWCGVTIAPSGTVDAFDDHTYAMLRQA